MTNDKDQSATDQRFRLLPAAIIATLVVVLFHFYGVTDLTYESEKATRSLFVWIARRWPLDSPQQNNFPYGWAAPLVCLWMIWHIRDELAQVPKRPNSTGLAVIITALLLHWIGAKTQQTRISIAAFMTLAWGIPFHLFGWSVARRLLAPIGFLAFASQFDFLFGFASLLRASATAMSAAVLNGLGVHADLPDATTLHAGNVVIAVAKQPGGLRSVMIVAAAAYLLAWLRQRGLVRQLLLLASAPFIVLIASVIRTTLHALAGAKAGSYPVFYLVAAVLLVCAHKLIGTDWWEKIARINQHPPVAAE